MGGMLSGGGGRGVDKSGTEAKLVESTVRENTVVVFSKTYCPYCRTAKDILFKLGVEPKVLELDRMEQGPIMQDVLHNITNARTVPRVFIKGQCIGGCSELKSLLNSGQLQQMLKP